MRWERAGLADAAFWLTCAIPVAVLVSIAASQILIGLAVVCLVASGQGLRLPRALIAPLGLFVGLTIVAWLASGDVRAGLPQIRKFFVFLTLPLVWTAIRRVRDVRGVTLACAGVAAVSALVSLGQFAVKYHAAEVKHEPFYAGYIARRITGFMSHWMTFGGEEMIVSLLALAYVLFGPANRRVKAWVCGALAVLALSMTLGMTRSVWLGTLAGLLYLMWIWRRVLILVVPVLLAAGMLFAPVRERAESLFRPHGDTDSNQFRVVVWGAGVRMIEAHPWLGLGPEALGRGVQNADARFILHGAIAAIVAVLVVGFAEYNLGDSEVLTLFLTTVGFAYIAARDPVADASPR